MEFVNASDKHETAKCGHFSIRAYVTEIRRKDSKICWPFPKVNNYKDLEGQTDVLPPLHVAEFRWWDCQNCLTRNEAGGAAIKTGEIVNYSNDELKTRIICSHGNVSMPSCGVAPKLISSTQQAAKEKYFELRKFNADSTTLNVNGNEYGPLLCSGKKETLTAAVHPMREVDDGANEVGKIKINLNINKQGRNLSSCKTSIGSKSVYNDKNALETVTLKAKGNGSIECCKANFGSCKLSDLLFRKLKCTSDGSTEICLKENSGFSRSNPIEMNKQHWMMKKGNGISEVADANIHENQDRNDVTGHISKIWSMDLDESDCDSFENHENIIGNNIPGDCATQDGDSIGTLHRKKIKKVRLLADVIRSEDLGVSGRDANIDHIKTEAAHSKMARDVSTGIVLPPGPKSEVPVQGYDRKVVLGKKKKSKMPQDGYEGPLHMRFPKGTPEKVRIFKGDAGTIGSNTAAVHSELETDASIGIGLCPGLMSPLIEHGNDKRKSLSKKKSTMPQIEHGESSLMPGKEGMSREVHSTRRSVEIKCIGAETVPSKLAQDVFTGRSVHPDFKSYVDAKSNAKKVILGRNEYLNSQVEDGKSFLMSWKDGVTGKDHFIRRDVDIKNKGAASIPFRSAQGSISGGCVHHGLSHTSINQKAIIDKNQNSMPIVEGGGNMAHVGYGGSSLFIRPEAFSGMCEDPILQGNPKVLKSQCDKKGNKTSEESGVDVIPMDIVELMAKNQHERLLFNAEDTTGNRNCLSGTTQNVKDDDSMNFTKVRGCEMLRLPHKKNSRMQKTQSSITGKRVATTSQKSDGYPSQVSSKRGRIHFSISQPEQSPASMGFAAFSHSLEKPSSGAQLPIIGSSRNCGDQNINLNRNTVQQGCSLTCFQSSDPYHTSHSDPQQGSHREDHHFWSSMIPNCKPFGINCLQKVAAESSNMNMLQFPQRNANVDHGPEFMETKVSHLEKQKRKFDSESDKRRHPGSSSTWRERGNEFLPKMVGPLDLCTNETISAMHLLRLMDAGVYSSTTVNVNENQKFTKQPPFLHDHHHEELSALEVGQTKNSGALLHPPSSVCFDKTRPGKPRDHFPSLSKVNVVGSSVQKDENFRRATGSRGNFSAKLIPNSLKAQVKEKPKSKMASTGPAQPRGLKSHRPISRDNSSGRCHEFYDLQKGFLSASDSMPFPIQSLAVEDSARHVEPEVYKKDATVCPGTSKCGIEICIINRNPADFSIPEPRNSYMIGPGDLKHRKIISSRDRPGLVYPNGHKRQRMMKLTDIQAHLQY